jgi:acyl carrier protein
MMQDEHRLRAFLSERFAGFDDGCADDADLSSVIDSMGLFDLLQFVEREFEINVPTEEFAPQRFSSIRRILELVNELKSQ